MRTYERNRVNIDQCVDCRGIFSDRGELEQLLDAEATYDQAAKSRGSLRETRRGRSARPRRCHLRRPRVDARIRSASAPQLAPRSG